MTVEINDGAIAISGVRQQERVDEGAGTYRRPMNLKVYGLPGSPQAHALRDFLHRSDVPFDSVEIQQDEQARALGLDGLSDRRLPVVIFGVVVRDGRTQSTETITTRWLFVCIGGAPRTEWAEAAGVIRDEAGYLVTGPELLREGRPPAGWPLTRIPYYLETNVPGLFAAGDVRHGSVKRCASAVGEGAMAVTFVHRSLADG